MPAKLLYHRLKLENGELVEWKGDPPAYCIRKGKRIKVVERQSVYTFLAKALKKS